MSSGSRLIRPSNRSVIPFVCGVWAFVCHYYAPNPAQVFANAGVKQLASYGEFGSLDSALGMFALITVECPTTCRHDRTCSSTGESACLTVVPRWLNRQM